MKFFEQFIMWDCLRKLPNSPYKGMSWKEFYNDKVIVTLFSADGLLAPSNLHMEKEWLQQGKPYYKIWPGVFDQFMSTRMDVDAEYLKRPHKIFTILFPDLADNHLLNYETGSGEWYLRSIMVQDYSAGEACKSDHYFNSLIDNKYELGGVTGGLAKMFPESRYKERKDRGVIKVRADFIPTDMNNPFYTTGVSDEVKLMTASKPPCILMRNIEGLSMRCISMPSLPGAHFQSPLS